jgi:AcrR family transcriptional regulator
MTDSHKGVILGTLERREREKLQKRNHIVDAAERLFFTKGYTTTSMDEVAEEAEFSKGTLYLYFKDKEDLYLAINFRGLLILKDHFEKAFQKGKSGIEKIRSIGEAYLLFSQEYPNYYRAMHYYECTPLNFEISDTSAQQCEEAGQQVLGIVAKAIQTGIEDGSVREDLDPMYTATVLWAHSTGMISIMSIRGDHLKNHHDVDIKKVVKLSLDMMQRSLEK